MFLRNKVAFAVATMLVCAASSASATEGGASLYLPGLRSPMAGFVPPPGFYFQNDAYYYYGELPGRIQTQVGGAVISNVKQRTKLDFLTPIWVTPLEVFGGNVAVSATLPLGVPHISAGALITAPRFGRSFAFSTSDSEFGVGDPVVSSFVGWHSGDFHWSTGVSVSIPAGGYQDGQLSNVALNRWVGDLYGALTYLNPRTGLEISGSAGFEINGQNNDTKYRSGNAFHADFSISQHFSKQFSIGVLAAVYQQVSADGGSGDRLGAYKGRTVALGATAAYSFEIGGVPISTQIKVLREVETDNRFKGTIGLFTIAIPLGGQAAPKPTAQSIVAKY